MPPNFSRAQPPNDGSSSLMKKPRYLTTGLSLRVPGSTLTSVLCATGTSAHQYQGETPILAEMS